MFEARILGVTLLCAATVMPGLTTEHRFAFGCALVGIMGQAAYQFLTFDKLKPTKKAMIGDVIVSAVCGWGVYALGGEVSQYTMFLAFWAGAGASIAFWGLMKKFRPQWVPEENGEEQE